MNHTYFIHEECKGEGFAPGQDLHAGVALSSLPHTLRHRKSPRFLEKQPHGMGKIEDLAFGSSP